VLPVRPARAGPVLSQGPGMLALNNIEVVYQGVILVLKGVSLVAKE
jgi:hypothetical protein